VSFDESYGPFAPRHRRGHHPRCRRLHTRRGSTRRRAMVPPRKIREAIMTASAGGGGGSAAATGSGWASLKGVFRVRRRPAAAQGAGRRHGGLFEGGHETLSIARCWSMARRRAWPNVVVFARKTSRLKNPPSDQPLVFDQKNCEFLSPVFAAGVGQPVDVRIAIPSATTPTSPARASTS